MRKLKIAAIGGGTGLSTMLKGLKLHTDEITAIVSVADDGGSSGILRSDMGMLPPGDVRNCIAALVDMGGDYAELLNYRFKEGVFAGHTVGNMLLAAINETSPNFDEAVSRLSKLVGISGRVVPVTNVSVTLGARLTDGTVIEGESNIGCTEAGRAPIDRVFLTPSDARPVNSAVGAIKDADVIVMGPGSLYTSIIPDLLVPGITEAIMESSAKKVYVCNIMTQPGETDGMDAEAHLDAIEKHSAEHIADYMIVNDAPVPESVREVYALEGAAPVYADTDKLAKRVNVLHGGMFLVQNGQIRHNFIRLARAIARLGESGGGHRDGE